MSEAAGSGQQAHRSGWRFPPERSHVLMDEERQRRLPREPILETLDLKAGDIVADVGAGPGYWTEHLARIVDPGTVYAFDVEPLMLDELRTSVARSGTSNVDIVQSREHEIPLADASVDVAVASCVLHEPADPRALLTEIIRILKPEGRLLVIDWRTKQTEKGPPIEHRIAQREVERWLEEAGMPASVLDIPDPDLYALLAMAPKDRVPAQ